MNEARPCVEAAPSIGEDGERRPIMPPASWLALWIARTV